MESPTNVNTQTKVESGASIVAIQKKDYKCTTNAHFSRKGCSSYGVGIGSEVFASDSSRDVATLRGTA